MVFLLHLHDAKRREVSFNMAAAGSVRDLRLISGFRGLILSFNLFYYCFFRKKKMFSSYKLVSVCWLGNSIISSLIRPMKTMKPSCSKSTTKLTVPNHDQSADFPVHKEAIDQTDNGNFLL